MAVARHRTGIDVAERPHICRALRFATITMCIVVAFVLWGRCVRNAYGQSARVGGTVQDDSRSPLLGVSVELRGPDGIRQLAITDTTGAFQFDRATAGANEAVFTLINFATARRHVVMPPDGTVRVDAILHFAVNADVTVTGKRTFMNLADVEHPEENLVGIAQAASQGAILPKQLGQRPLMRQGEVLETVPGVIVTQHSGEGKANQYLLRGFNLDHGTVSRPPSSACRSMCRRRRKTTAGCSLPHRRQSGPAICSMRWNSRTTMSRGSSPTTTEN
jgi:hypothetical protein